MSLPHERRQEEEFGASAWSPLHNSVFRVLWIATVASNLGSWMQDVGESWLMTSLTTSPVLVALVETAGSLPVVLIALPAGALADIVDRRRLLLVMQIWMLAAAGAMGILTLLGHMTPDRLLSLTFLLGVGTAISNPVWQAITPELVPQSDLPAAITLNAAGINIARAIGPAVGGFIIAASGPWAVFLLNAASFIGIMFVLYRWSPAPRKSKLPPEDIIGAMRAGTRYLRHSPELQIVLLRSGIFVICASALWALLPTASPETPGSGLFRLRSAPRLYRTRSSCRCLVSSKGARAALNESIGRRWQYRVWLRHNVSRLLALLRTVGRRTGNRWRRVDRRAGQPECFGTDSYSVVGSRTSDGHLPSDLLRRSRRRQRRLGVCGDTSWRLCCSFRRCGWSGYRTFGELALPSRRQYEFVSNAFTALARASDDDRH